MVLTPITPPMVKVSIVSGFEQGPLMSGMLIPIEFLGRLVISSVLDRPVTLENAMRARKEILNSV